MAEKKVMGNHIEKNEKLGYSSNDMGMPMHSAKLNVQQSPLDYLKDNYLSDIEKMSIADIFYSKTFDLFNSFCRENSIDRIDKLTRENLEEFFGTLENQSNRKKMEFKVNHVLEEIGESFSSGIFELQYLNMFHKDTVRETDIEDVFDERKFLIFNEFCQNNGIRTISDLNSNDIVRFSFMKSVGRKKREEVEKRIEEFLFDILGDTEEDCIYSYIKDTYPNDLMEKKITDIFKEYKYTLFRIYCSDNDILTLYELDVDSQRRFFIKFETKESINKAILSILKKEYMSIIKKNVILSKIIPDENFVIEDPNQKNIEKNYFKLVSIDDVLPDKYAAYCCMKEKLKEEGVENLLDVMAYDVSKLKHVSGVGEKRYSEFRDYLENKIHECREIAKIIKNENFVLNDRIYSVVKEKTIREVIVALGLKEERKAYNLDEIGQYQGVKYSDIDDYSLIKNLIDIKDNLEKIVDIKKTVKSLGIQNYSEIDKKILREIIINKKSEEKISHELGLSMEAVRKYEKSIIKRINRILDDRKFSIALRILYNDYRNMDMEKLYDYIDDEDKIIIDIIKSNIVVGIFYIPETDTMSYFQICAVMNNPKKEIDKAPVFGDISYIRSVLSKYREINVDDKTFVELLKNTEYSKILSENGVKLVDNYYYKDNISKICLFEMYLKYYHKEPFRISKESVEEYNKFFSEKFGMNMNMNCRSLEGLGARSENIILVNPRTYSHIDYVGVDEVTVLHMKKILDLRLSRKSCINAKEVYDVMKDYYPEDFYSKHHVYSLINHYFDDYSTSRGNSLDITKKGNKILSKTDVIYDICKENDSIINIKDLKEKTEWSMNRIYNAIDNSEDVIKLGPNKCVIIEDILTNSIKEKIIKISEDAFKEGYAFTNSIYNEYILKDPELRKFVNRYEIIHAKEIASLIKYLNEDIVGNNNFLYKKGQKITSLEDVIKIKFSNYLSRDELKEFLLNCGYSQISIYQTMDRIVSKGIYVQIGKEDFLIKENFDVDDKVKKVLVDFVDSKMDEFRYFIPNKYLDEMSEIIDLEKYSLNQFIISNLLEMEGYRRLFRYKMKNDLDVIVLVEKDSPYKDIDELTHDILEKKYDGEMDEKSVYDFLSEIGIYEKTDDMLFKKMYNDMNINGCIKVDEEGIVSLH